MTKRVRELAWKADALARDLHLLPGRATRVLNVDLQVAVANPAKPVGDDDIFGLPAYLAAHAEATFEFRPLYRATLHGDVWDGDGLGYTLSVHRKTGVVTLGAAEPAPDTLAKRNFIIEAVLTSPERVLRTAIRIQIHHAVKGAWLTPGTMTVRLGGTVVPTSGPRFTVRAEFTDGLVGDVTLNHDVTWTTSPPGRVTAEGFLRPTAPGDSTGDVITVTATLPKAVFGSAAGGTLHTAEGKLVVAQPWSASALTATPITGGAAGVLKEVANTPNVLFLSDGFPAADRPHFERVTDLIVDRLRTDPTTRPYDMLAPSINFWRCFVPAATGGLSCREEVYEPPGSAGGFVRPLPPALRPPDGPWTQVAHLLYAVGLPTPADAGSSVNEMRTDWGSLVAAEHAPIVADHTLVADPVIAEWLTLAARGMIDEIDGFPGVAMGSPPAASNRANALLGPHEGRGGRPELENFLNQISAPVIVPGATKLGELWGVGTNPAWRFDSRELLVLLSSYPGGRPLNMHPPISIGTDNQRATFPVTKVIGRKAYTLLPLVVPAMAMHLARAVAHEMAHSFGLGDEYREFKERDPQVDDRDVDWYSNLQYVTAVEVGGPGDLLSSRIKWNWHRIRKAAVVNGAITEPTPGTFRVPVETDAGSQFAVGDPVLLRVRVWGGVLGNPPTVALSSVHEGRVVAPIAPDAVQITAGPTSFLSAADLAPFTPGSLIYMPVPAPAAVASATLPYAELVAKNIRDYIDTNHKPMTVVPCSIDPELTFTLPALPGVNFKPGFCGLCKPGIVGIYEGGNRYCCGVFRPAGECNMGPSEPHEDKQFCAVCRYALVDAIDPTQHGALDRGYERDYPL